MRNDRSGLDGSCGQPAHQPRRICCQEVIACRREIDVPKAWRVQPHALNTSDNGGRKTVEQCDLIDRILDDDAGRMELLADVGLALEDDDAHAGPRQSGGTGEAGETGAYDDAITLRRRSGHLRALRFGGQGGHAAGRKYSTMPAPTDTSTKPAYMSGLMPALGGWISIETSTFTIGAPPKTSGITYTGR